MGKPDSQEEQARRQVKKVNDLINDIEKTDAGEVAAAFNTLLDKSEKYVTSEEIFYIYQKAKDKFGENFERDIRDKMWNNSAFKSNAAKELSSKFRAQIDSTSAEELDRVTTSFKDLIKQNEERELYSPEEINDLYQKAKEKYKDPFVNAVKEDLERSRRYEAGEKYVEALDFVLNKKDPAEAAKTFKDLLFLNAGGDVSSDKIDDLYLSLSERYGTQFWKVCDPPSPNIEKKLFDIKINELEKELQTLDLTGEDAKKQYIDNFYSVRDSLDSARKVSGQEETYDWPWRKLRTIGMDASVKIGEAFWNQKKLEIGDIALRGQFARCKTDISNAVDVDQAAEIFSNMLGMWKKYYQANKTSTIYLPRRAEDAAKVYVYALGKFGNDFYSTLKSNESFPVDDDHPENILLVEYVNNVMAGEFVKSADEKISASSKARDQLTDQIDDIEKTDAKDAVDAFNHLMDVGGSDVTSEELCYLYQKAKDKFGESFDQGVSDRLWKDSGCKSVLQSDLNRNLKIKFMDLVDSSSVENFDAVTTSFKELIKQNEERELYSSEELRELYQKALDKFGKPFTDSVEADLQQSSRYKTGELYFAALDLVSGEVKADDAAKTFIELSNKNATNITSGKKICDLYLKFAEKYGMQFCNAVEETFKEEYPASFGKIEESLYYIKINALEKELQPLGLLSDLEETNQYIENFYSVSKALDSAKSKFSSNAAYDWALRKLKAVGLNASAKIGEAFWGKNKSETSGLDFEEQLLRYKENIDKTVNVNESAAIFRDTLKLWKKFFDKGMKRINNADNDYNKAFRVHNLRIHGDQAAEVFLYAEKKFGNNFTNQFAELFGNDANNLEKPLLGELIWISRTKDLESKIGKYDPDADQAARENFTKALSDDLIDALGKPGNAEGVNKYLRETIRKAAHGMEESFTDKFKAALEDKPNLKGLICSGDIDSLDSFVEKQDKERAENLQNDINKRCTGLKKFADELKAAKRITDSDQYRLLCTVLDDLSTKSISLIDRDTGMLKDQYKDLTDSQIKSLPYVLAHKAIDPYLEHKAKDGINSNAYDKLDIIERLNQHVGDQIEKLKPENFICLDPNSENTPLSFIQDTIHMTYRRDYLAARKQVKNEIESGKLKDFLDRNMRAGSEEKLDRLIKDTSGEPEFPSSRYDNLDYDKMARVKSCIDRIMLKAQVNNLNRNAEKLVNGELKSPAPSHLRKACKEVYSKGIVKKAPVNKENAAAR